MQTRHVYVLIRVLYVFFTEEEACAIEIFRDLRANMAENEFSLVFLTNFLRFCDIATVERGRMEG